MATLPEYLISKWQQVRAGVSQIFSDAELDTLSAFFAPQDSREADRFFYDFATVYNPAQCGVLDRYIGYLKGGA